MTAAEFKKKWSRYHGKESAAYQEHFNDLCRLLNQPTPAQADPSGSDFFCFQKRASIRAMPFTPRNLNCAPSPVSTTNAPPGWT